jgi:hypothetical protein
MRFQGAVVKEQGVTFAIVVVKQGVVANRTTADQMAKSFQRAFQNLPIVLMEQDSRGRPTYYGRKDIVSFLARVPLSAIPWKNYTLNQVPVR